MSITSQAFHERAKQSCSDAPAYPGLLTCLHTYLHTHLHTRIGQQVTGSDVELWIVSEMYQGNEAFVLEPRQRDDLVWLARTTATRKTPT